MARPLRFVPANALVEVTTRTFQGRLLLKPSPELTEIILGVIANAISARSRIPRPRSSKKTQAPTRLRKTAWHCGQRVMAITPGLCEFCRL